MVKVGLVDINGPSGLAGELYSHLLLKGYEIKFAQLLSDLGDIESFDVLILHVGICEQEKTVEFVKTHQKIRTAIITTNPWDYFKTDLPILSYRKLENVVRYIEQKPTEDI
jgi:coenzyme F420-reducing hydrogenase gamma subunit